MFPRAPTRSSTPIVLALSLLLVGACAEPDEPLAIGEAHEARGGHSDSSRELGRQLAQLRRQTAPFHNVRTAAAAGYTEQITPCWQHRNLGAMGYHIGNPAFIDGAVNLLEPELLMYEPGRRGKMKLVGLEYIVPIDAWSGDSPPTLLGQVMHRHSTLPIYKLHIWLWQSNPRGIFADWNPRVSCRRAEETEYFE